MLLLQKDFTQLGNSLACVASRLALQVCSPASVACNLKWLVVITVANWLAQHVSSEAMACSLASVASRLA